MSTESGGAPGRQGPRGRWSSRAGFILATAGFSVGLGNIWRFPYLVGENGGGAFLVVYVAIAILIGIPLITAELSLGRKSRLTPIAGMARLTGSRTSPWNLIGWLGVAAAVLITSYYLMLIAWLAAYLVMFIRIPGMGLFDFANQVSEGVRAWSRSGGGPASARRPTRARGASG